MSCAVKCVRLGKLMIALITWNVIQVNNIMNLLYVAESVRSCVCPNFFFSRVGKVLKEQQIIASEATKWASESSSLPAGPSFKTSHRPVEIASNTNTNINILYFQNSLRKWSEMIWNPNVRTYLKWFQCVLKISEKKNKLELDWRC